MNRTYSFVASEIEPNSLQSQCVTVLKSGNKRIRLGRLYRYQGVENDVKVYRDIDGCFKPLEELTICEDDF